MSARSSGTVELHGVRCRAFDVTADLGRASAATTGGLPSPNVERFEDLLTLPLTVALDADDLVHRVAGSDTFGETGNTSYAVELHDFGSAPAIEWDKLPQLTEPA